MDRREFLKNTGTGTAIAMTIIAAGHIMTPAEAYAKKLATIVLDADETETLSALGEALARGARTAGIAHFVDYQLGLNPNDCLLMAKYFNIRPPYRDFYKAGLKALDTFTRYRFGQPFHKLDKVAARQAVLAISTANPEGWHEGPPAPLFYMLARSDAVDMVYGTQTGFEKLGIPYMAHIEPPKPYKTRARK